MNKIQFLLSFIVVIPFFSAFAIFSIKNNRSFISILASILALIMLGNIVNLFHNYDGNLNAISFVNIAKNLDIGLSLTGVSLIIAAIVIFIWLIMTIYSNEYFIFSNDKRFFAFKLFSILSVGFILLVIFSKNLISLFVFYQCLIFCLYFFNAYFMYEKDFKASHNFTFSLLASSLFMFLATVLTYKIAGTTEFMNQGILTSNISSKQYFVLLIFFILAIAGIALFPLQLLFSRLYNLNAPIIIMIFVISYGLVGLLILLKVILNIFGFEYFIKYTNHFNLSYVLNWVIALNLLFSGFWVMLQKNLKKMLIFLFFNQLIFAYFLFLILNQTIDRFVVVIISFILSQTLIFLCFGNINIYLLRSREKQLIGVFYKLRLTISLLCFALLNLLGLVPAIGLVEKYLLIKNYFTFGFNMNFLIILANLFLVFLVIIRIVYPMVDDDINHNQNDVILAKKIDHNLSFILPAFIVALLMFFSFIFSRNIIDHIKIFLS